MKKILIITSLIIGGLFLCFSLWNKYEYGLYSHFYINPNPTEDERKVTEKIITPEPYYSLIEVIANPEKFKGKRIMVEGVAQLQFEHNALYLSKGDRLNHVTKNAIWIRFPEDTSEEKIKELKKLNGRYVEIVGYFSTETGHWGFYSGTIEKIQNYGLKGCTYNN